MPTAAFVTQQGMILGTIHYMSPEQALGKTIDGRTDVFSLGVVLYEMATGRRPFSGETITETMTQIIRDEPTEPLLVNPGISPGMNEIIQRSLRKNIGERFTAAELVTALDAQLGRAKTAPYTSANAVTAKAAAQTLLTGSKLKTVQESPARRRGGWLAELAYVAVILAMAGVGVAYWLSHRSKPIVAKPQTVASPATSSVDVTALPTATIVETTTTTPVSEKPATTPPARETAGGTPALPGSRVETSTTVAEGSGPAQTEAEPGADALYATAMTELSGGDWMQARKTLHRVLKQDPHYAKAHFRMGEIALFNRNFNPATEELNLAMADSDRLNPHEQQLARLSLAIASHSRFESERIAAEIWQRWPGDPELARMHATFPGMFNDLTHERGRRRLRP
jgi:serine/threonine-protein kinase